MAADPIQAARNVTKLEEVERRSTDIRSLVTRGLIADFVAQMGRIVGNRTVTGPEEIKLQDYILSEVARYAKAIGNGSSALEYMSPSQQAQRVEEQSQGMAELARQRMEAAAETVEKEVRELIAINVPKARGEGL